MRRHSPLTKKNCVRNTIIVDPIQIQSIFYNVQFCKAVIRQPFYSLVKWFTLISKLPKYDGDTIPHSKSSSGQLAIICKYSDRCADCSKEQQYKYATQKTILTWDNHYYSCPSYGNDCIIVWSDWEKLKGNKSHIHDTFPLNYEQNQIKRAESGFFYYYCLFILFIRVS